MDLNFNCTDDLATLRPLLFWVRIWSTEELIHYREGLAEILALEGGVGLSWLKYIRGWFFKLGLRHFWEDPLSLTLASKKLLKKTYWLFIHEFMLHSSRIGSLTIRFLQMKMGWSFEIFMDEIQPSLANSLYLKYCYGVLQINSNTSKWDQSNRKEDKCVSCDLCTVESETHLMFFVRPI